MYVTQMGLVRICELCNEKMRKERHSKARERESEVHFLSFLAVSSV